MSDQTQPITEFPLPRMRASARRTTLTPAPASTAASRVPVVLLCPMGFGLRNVLHSGMVGELRARGVEPIILHGGEDVRSADGADAQPVAIDAMLTARPTSAQRGKAAFDALLRASFNRHHRIASYGIFNRWLRRNDILRQHVRNALVEVLAVAGSSARLLDWQMARQERAVRASRDLAPIRRHLETLRPALVVSTSCIAAAEHPYTLAARDLAIPTLACILSFDNLTSRGTIPRFDAYAVWNERMREQVLRFYPDRDPARVYITGTPQFDFHYRDEFRWTRAATLARLGLRANDRYMLYAANGAAFTPTEPALVDAFARRCAAVPQLAAHRIVVRLHPLDDHRRWDGLANTSDRAVVARPWDGANPHGPDAQAVLVNSLRYADACLNVASTMSLDAAAVDTPVVCVAFAAHNGSGEDRFYRTLFSTEHYRPIAASGGVRIARSMQELIAEVAAYIDNPRRDQDTRRSLVEHECGRVDGRAAARVAELIGCLARERAHAE